MGDSAEANIRLGAEPFLQQGEQIVTTLIASVRGHQQATVGGIAGMVGGHRQSVARRSADAANVRLASPMALVLTSRRVLTFAFGGRGKAKELLNDFSLAQVESMQVNRMGLGGLVTVTLAGAPVRLESRVGAARSFAAELDRVKSG
jgi:hypothetical protein